MTPVQRWGGGKRGREEEGGGKRGSEGGRREDRVEVRGEGEGKEGK